ncbi:MAG: hypothetical protein ACKOS8_11490, partial [Gemmataceae bacterium]
MRAISLSLTALLMALLATVGQLPAQGPGKTAAGKDTSKDGSANQGEVSTNQARLQREFSDFKLSLKLLEQRLTRTGKAEDKLRAQAIQEALRIIGDLGTDAKFDTLVQALKQQDAFKSTDKLQGLVERNKELSGDLTRLIEALTLDPEAELRRQRDEAKKIVEKLKDVISKQERVRANTETDRLTPEELARAQAKVTKETQDLKDLMEGKKNQKNKDGQDSKEGKDKDGKDKDGKDSKEGKDKDGKDKDGMSKDGKDKDAKGKDGKDKDGMSKDGKDKDGKDSKEGKDKDGKDKDGMSKDGKDKDAKGKDGKDKDGMSKDGKDKDGKDSKGKDKDGKDKDGMSKDGKDKDAKGKDGKDKDGMSKDGKDKDGKDSKGK